MNKLYIDTRIHIQRDNNKDFQGKYVIFLKGKSLKREIQLLIAIQQNNE